MNRNKSFVLLTTLVILLVTLACAVNIGGEPGISDARTAFDEKGDSPTSVFAPADDFYVVAHASNLPAGTVITAKWYALNVEGTDPNTPFYESTLDIDEDFSGDFYFQLTNSDLWPVGDYRVDLYLDDTLGQSVEFSVSE
ncbi:MAG: hypothetical protein D6770_01790 [Anaerolineae bacterium]|nr:MAG: hypothetical protein D6770_01790 [Anaerolineae bacterium]